MTGRAGTCYRYLLDPASQHEPPRPPFARWPIHVFHRDYGYAWYCSARKALVTQTTVTQGRAEGGRVLCDWIDLILLKDGAGIATEGGVFLFHDFRSLAGYDTATRQLINERIKLRRTGYARRTIMVIRPTPIWQMAMRVTDLTLAMLGVPPAKLTSDIERAMHELDGITLDRKPPAWFR
jgi:hypothetical protein